ncbi:MAG: glycoside hydrolase family 127 protein [Clostridia bacterium]|nr:glycoside hydrolase family 127 protein [Clostridia bacterium]
MKQGIDEKELSKRIALNLNRFETGDYYQFENIFSPEDYDWQGDKEGRALLAFASHCKISGTKIPCMDKLISAWDTKTNSKGFFGADYGNMIHEQQLSGHSWVLRGLCEHYELFGEENDLRRIRDICENLFLNRKGRFLSYPTDRSEDNSGGVSGSESVTIGNWILSSDVGCAFMAIDGLSHAYKVLKDENILALLDEMIPAFEKIDKVKIKMQTHCSLTAGRGMMRLYELTENKKYLLSAQKLWNTYVYGGGITATYQNLNWWGRPDSWTEPCAIVDSIMLSVGLYKATGNEEYRSFAAKAYHNGLATAQRPNGGAGTDTVVSKEGKDTLYSDIPEAFFCCTMRLAEGLWFINENKDLLYAEVEGRVTKDNGVYSDGDIIYAEVSPNAEAYAEKFVFVDGRKLCPIIKFYRLPEDLWQNVKQKILF